MKICTIESATAIGFRSLLLEIPLTGNSSPWVLQPDLGQVDRLPVLLLSRPSFQVVLLDLGCIDFQSLWCSFVSAELLTGGTIRKNGLAVFWILKCYLFWDSLCWESFMVLNCHLEFLVFWHEKGWSFISWCWWLCSLFPPTARHIYPQPHTFMNARTSLSSR